MKKMCSIGFIGMVLVSSLFGFSPFVVGGGDQPEAVDVDASISVGLVSNSVKLVSN